jgi:serralysin
MFTSVIARAFADGTEFVTGADLAKRIESFVDTDIEITGSGSGNDIVATVTGSDAGKFALDVDTDQMIASVANWYAFDGKKVFLPRNGGTFDITLGAQAADVTRIADLPMRAELISLSGNGADLSFRMSGKGQAVVELQAPNGRSVVATGADASAVSGERMTLTFNSLGTHDVSIDFQGGAAAMAAMAGARGFVPQTVKGTAGDDLMLAGSGGARLAGGLGDDTLVGSSADDVFVFAGGIDRIVGFDGDDDRIDLVDSGFAGPGAALLAFKEVAAGVLLSLSETDRLLIRGIDLDDLGREDLLVSDSLLS